MEDKEIGHQIATNAKWKPLNLINNTTLPELALLLKQAKLMVSNDTGPMHLAGALGTPVVAIFGPTNLLLTGPYGSKNKVVKHDVPCGPCLKRTCPGYGLVCMAEINVDEVFAAASKFLT